MKKYIYLFALLAVVMFTSCGDEDQPINKQTFNMTTNSRTINGEEVLFSQGTAKVELNYTDMFIRFTADYMDANGETHSLTTPEMKLNSTSSTVYSFNNIASDEYIGIQALQGYIDMSTGMLWYTLTIEGSTKVVSSSHLLYAYTTTTITNPDNGNHGSHEQSAYLFALDARGETCIMQISNFMSNISLAVDASQVQYSGLTVTPTVMGYKITAEQVESNYKGFYTLTDVDFTLDGQGHVINGSFKCNDLEYTVSGRLFPSSGDINF